MALITFEGIEGSGKTTQIEKLYTFLVQNEIAVIKTREPGGTPFGQKLREILLNPETKFHHKIVESLLFTADRLEHIETIIKPALNQKKIVICDRFIDSTLAYQIGGRQNNPKMIRQLCKIIPIQPEITVLLDLSPEEGLRRAQNRSKIDRFEHEKLAFHQRVRTAYLTLAKKNPQRICVISVENKNPEDVFQEIKTLLFDKLNLETIIQKKLFML